MRWRGLFRRPGSHARLYRRAAVLPSGAQSSRRRRTPAATGCPAVTATSPIRPGARRPDLVLHLHRLDGDQRLALRHLGPLDHADRHHQAGQRRADLDRAAGLRPASRASASVRSRQVWTVTAMRRPARVTTHELPQPSTSAVTLRAPSVRRAIAAALDRARPACQPVGSLDRDAQDGRLERGHWRSASRRAWRAHSEPSAETMEGGRSLVSAACRACGRSQGGQAGVGRDPAWARRPSVGNEPGVVVPR